MTEERLNEIERLVARMNRVHGLSREELHMLRAMIELLNMRKSQVLDAEDAYRRGYEAGKHDEADRLYELEKARKKPGAKPEPEPEEESPFGEGGLL